MIYENYKELYPITPQFKNTEGGYKEGDKFVLLEVKENNQSGLPFGTILTYLGRGLGSDCATGQFTSNGNDIRYFYWWRLAPLPKEETTVEIKDFGFKGHTLQPISFDNPLPKTMTAQEVTDEMFRYAIQALRYHTLPPLITTHSKYNSFLSKSMSIITSALKSKETKAYEYFELINADGTLTSRGRNEVIDYIFTHGAFDKKEFDKQIVKAWEDQINK